VNLAESRPLVDTLLSNLPNMFANTRTSDSCLGSALDAAFQCIQHIGGKLVVLSTSLPSVGPGKLKQREMPKMLGSEKEHTLLAPDAGEDGAFYKNKAVDFSRQQISCDTFLFGSIGGGSSGGYVDVATVGALSRYTAGQCYYYGPTYLPNIDGPRFAADLKKDLLRTTGFESVMRIRCSKGVTISNFYGNFFIRGTDLLALPNVTPGTAFNVELALETEEAAGASQGGAGGGGGSGLPPGSTISIQAALLYTATNGERRICVHTLCKPVTTLVTDLYKGVDVDSLASMYAKVALDHALRQGLHLARRYLHTSLVDLVRAYRAATSPAYGSGGGPAAGPMGHGPRGPVGMGMSAPGATQAALQQQAAMQGDVTAMLPENLQLLPLYILALMKSPLYRGGDAIKSDERSALVYRMLTMPVSFSRLFVYPRLYGLHDFDEQCGRPDPQPSFPSPLLPGQSVPHPADIELQQPPVVLPPALNLTAERLSTEGVYLLDSGCDLYLWCGRAAPQQLLMALFGVPSLDGVDLNNLTLQPQGNDYSHRVLAIVNTLRTYSAASVAGQQQKLRIVREGSRDVNEQRFHWFLVEDKQPFPGGDKSYGEYLPIVARDSHASAMAGVGMGGVGAVGPGGGLGY
jgi:protein transport protein SEC24